MKKIYITAIPLNIAGRNIEKFQYMAAEGCHIQNDVTTAFPILKVMKSTLEKDEDYKIVAIQSKSADYKQSEEMFRAEVEEQGYDWKYVQFISIDENQSKKTMNTLLMQIIRSVTEHAEVYASIEYGTKIMTITTIYALQMAEKIRSNVEVAGIFYGEIKRSQNAVIEANLYDVSSIYYLNSLFQGIEVGTFKDPEQFIEMTLNLEK